jgi:quinol monooxygenase YgiN
VLAAVGVRLSLPANSGYPVLCAVAAGLAWFAMTTVQGLDAVAQGTGRGLGRDRSDDGESRDGHELGDSGSEAAMRGRRGRDRDETWDGAARERQGGNARDRAPRGGGRGGAEWPGQDGYQRGEADSGYADSGYPGSGYPGSGYPGSGYPGSGYEDSRYADAGYRDSGRRDSGYPRSGYPENGYPDSGYAEAGYAAGPGTRTPARQPSFSPAAPTDNADPLTAGNGRSARDFPAAAPTAQYGRLSAPQGTDAGGPEFTPAAAAGAARATAGTVSSRPYGRISIFTLLEDKVADFDRLAEQAAEGVRTAEPDTLVYVIHVVPKAPMQRIFYEIYRDRPAFESHERQPHILRFAAERRSCVLATNIIELRLKYAKVAPVPAATQQSKPAIPPALEPGARSGQSGARPAPEPGARPAPQPGARPERGPVPARIAPQPGGRPGPEPGTRPAPRPQSPGWGQPSYPGQRPGGR